jgi:hypothetical protein
VLLSLWWSFVYIGGDWLTARRTQRVRIHLDAELSIPFVPAFVLAYLSLDVVFVPAAFILRSRRELNALTLSMAVMTGVAGIGFLLFPAEAAFPEDDPGAWSGLFAVARGMALRHNMVPSLHVAMGCVCLAAYATRCGPAGKCLLAAWGAAIAIGTLFTHQHHVIDVVTGLALAAAGKRFIYDRWLLRAPRIAPANPDADPVPPA